MLYLCRIVTMAVLSVGVPCFAASQIYQYTDDSGTVNFTTDLGSIPEHYRSRAIPLDAEPASSGGATTTSAPSAAVREVTASGEYRMGEHDTRADAIRLAMEAAKRAALEQVATYLESVTEVTNADVTRDEIRTYTAGIVTVVDQQVQTRVEGETVVIHVDLTGQVDPTEVAHAITALRDNESAKQELLALRAETDQLHRQLEEANQALTTAALPDQVHTLTQQRQDLLNQLQTNALVSQAWTDWVYVTPIVYPYPWIGLQQVHGLLLQARQLNPHNRHLEILQQFVTAQASGFPAAGHPGWTPSLPPHHSLLMPPPAPQQLVPQPRQPQFIGSNPVTPATPPHPSRPLPPTLQQLHPPHVGQPNPPVLRAPYAAPFSHQHIPSQHFGGAGGRSGGGHVGGGHHGR